MITGISVALFIVGLFALIVGRYDLGRKRVLRGPDARVCGLLLVVQLPVGIVVAFVAALALGASQAVAKKEAVELAGHIATWGQVFALVVCGVAAQRLATKCLAEQEHAAPEIVTLTPGGALGPPSFHIERQ
jgi:hypothetical protein